MQRRDRMALLAIAVIVLAAITGLAGRPSAARSAAAPPAASTLAPEARQHPVGHADRTALPSLRVSSMRQADLRLDLPRLPWLVAFGATALALLAAAGPAWNVRPAVVRLPPTTSRTTRQVRGPPQPV